MSLERALQYLNILAAIALVLRLSVAHLAHIYRSFFLLICYEAVSGLLGLAFTESWMKFDYRLYWLWLRPVELSLYLAVCYSIVRRLLTDHPGIYSVSRRITTACFVLALLTSVLSAQLEYSAGIHNLPVNIALIAERAVYTGALVVLLLSLSYLLWFPVGVTRNLAVLSSGLVIFFASDTTLVLARNLWSPQSLRLVSTVLGGISTACLVFWAVCISAIGERTTVRPGHSWKADDQQKVLAQLDALNAALIRNARS